MRVEFIEKIYAGWLAKIIGIHLGAPVEGWTYEKIKNIFGEIHDYPVDYQEFAADDDSNGPLFLLRALEEGKNGFEMQSQDVAEALLNYAPYEHGFFWWGGYGVSTEHTAYLNLRNGIPAPKSGSVEQNGDTVAEQIGGQIFIDTWGLVTPGKPELAAKYAKKAAEVTHGGNGVFGGMFVASCISYAFVEKDIKKIIGKGLSYIPEECEYARVVKSVMEFYEKHPHDWRLCYKYIFENFGYDKYPGCCHIIPNSAVMILSLLYGAGDFSDTLNICNMCGWDTDCNVGNVATIMGVRNGLKGIEYDKWRKPVHDLLICSSVVGSLNIMDIPYGATYIAKLAYALDGEEMPEPWKTIAEKRIESCHFEYPGSTHSIRVRVEGFDEKRPDVWETFVVNTDESAATGKRALKVIANRMQSGENVYAYKKTYYCPKDFFDSRYDPSFSPIVYPGQIVHASVCIPAYSCESQVSLYVRDIRNDIIYTGEKHILKKGEWKKLSFEIPVLEAALLGEMGVCFYVTGQFTQTIDFTALLDDLYIEGTPEYGVDFSKETEEVWTNLHKEISQMTRLKGLMYLKDGELHLSCADYAEAYTGHYNWKDYYAEYSFVPIEGEYHMVNFRVQGAIRSYAFGFLPGKKVGLLKNDNGYKILTECPFAWENGKKYVVKVTVKDNWLVAEIDDCRIEFLDEERPYRNGFIGVSVRDGSHAKYQKIKVGRV